jgi:hypothetical protein
MNKSLKSKENYESKLYGVAVIFCLKTKESQRREVGVSCKTQLHLTGNHHPDDGGS